MAVVIKGSGSIEGSTGLEMGANGTTEIRGQVNVAVGSSVAGVSTATNFAPTLIPTSNRNLIINGDFKIAQRSTSEAITGYGYHTVDRFHTVANSSMSYAVTMSQETDGPSGFEKCVKLLTTSASTPTGSHNYTLRTTLEAGTIRQLGWGTSDSKASVLSFWVKSNKTGTYTSQIYIKGQSSTVSMTVAYTISSSATWEKKTISIPAYTTSLDMQTTHTNGGCTIDWGLASGPDDITSAFSWAVQSAAKAVTGQVNLLDTVNNYWQLTGVQFEVGEQATPFEHRSYGEDLRRCQRYYYLAASGADAYQNNRAPICTSANYSATHSFGVVYFPVNMRTIPSNASVEGTDYFRCFGNSNSDTFDSVSLQSASTQSFTIQFYGNLSRTAGSGSWIETENSATRIAFKAEL